MELMDWFPAITTTSLFAAALWFGQNLIRTRLTNSVAHEFNAKLEELRAQLREGEERFKADLRAKEAEIAALRGGAMTALASRQVAVDKRRLEAIDQLWSAVNALAPARAISAMMSSIKFEAAAKESEKDPKVREFFRTLGSELDPRSLDLSGAAKARPFVSPVAWATYSAFQAIVLHAVTRLRLLQTGLGTKDFLDNEGISKLAKVALPHAADYIDRLGPAIYHQLAEQLEAKLLQDINDMLSGTEADKARIQQAAEILKQIDEVRKQTNADQFPILSSH